MDITREERASLHGITFPPLQQDSGISNIIYSTPVETSMSSIIRICNAMPTRRRGSDEHPEDIVLQGRYVCSMRVDRLVGRSIVIALVI